MGLRTAGAAATSDSPHMPHREERDRYVSVVGSWLRGHDGDVAHDAPRTRAELPGL